MSDVYSWNKHLWGLLKKFDEWNNTYANRFVIALTMYLYLNSQNGYMINSYATFLGTLLFHYKASQE